MTDSWRLESFDWLPLRSWNVENLIGPYKDDGFEGYCKICDTYIYYTDLESHVKKHLKEYEKLSKRKKRQTDQKKKEALRRAREARKNKKERDMRERKYQEGSIEND